MARSGILDTSIICSFVIHIPDDRAPPKNIPRVRVKVKKENDFVKQAPFDKRSHYTAIWITHKNLGIPKIRGIREKRYNEEIFSCVSGPD
jgi:hypothetical protein